MRRARVDVEKLFALIGYEPHEGQLAVHQSQARRRVVACGVRWGKSLSAAVEALVAALTPRKKSIGWVVAPTYDLADKVFREILDLLLEHFRPLIRSVRRQEKLITITNLGGGESQIKAKSADNPDSLLGEGLDWVIADEAARLRPYIWTSHLSQRLIDRRGWALMISTPKGKGQFYELYQRGQDPNEPDWESWNAPSWQNPHLDRALIEAEREKLPERVFQQEYGGQFIEGAGAVFRNVRDVATGEWEEPKRDVVYVAGLDLAKVADFTVLCVMTQDRRLVFADRFNKVDWSFQVQRIKAVCDRYNYARVLVDSTGAGEPIYESLAQAGCYVEGYQFTNRSKSDLINNLALMFEQREITLPRPELWPTGIDELESFEYSILDSGNTKMGAPSGMHDDCVVSLGLAAWQVRQRGEPMAFRVGRPRWPRRRLR